MGLAETHHLDVIHAHYAVPHAAGAYLAKQIFDSRRLKTITTLHGTDITLVGADPSFRRVVEFAIENSDGVTAVSRFLRDRTIEEFDIKREIRVIYNFVDLARPGQNQDACSRGAFALKGEMILRHASNFRPIKRIGDVVRIFARVRERIPAKLLLIGDGPERPAIQQLVTDMGLGPDVHFLGEQDQLEPLFFCTDLFLLPSEQESFGLTAGFTILAPCLIISVILGWDFRLTIFMIGGLVIIYTASGGTEAVSKTHLLQMLIITAGMGAALYMVFHRLPSDISFPNALHVAGKLAKLNVINFGFDWKDRYNFWSGLIGGAFVALSYFGTDQSQGQRYLTGRSITQSRIGLLANGVLKVPMQFIILFIGAMIFVFYQFVTPPLFFNPVETAAVKSSSYADAYAALESDYFRANGEKQINLRKMPGLILAAILSASMSASSSELNALASVTVVDIYKRMIRKNASDRHYILVPKGATVFWGLYAIAFAQFANHLGSLIEAVNILGSLFYGTILGLLCVAFYFKKIGGNAAFTAALIAETVVLACYAFTEIPYLWFNVIGCLILVALARLLNPLMAGRGGGELKRDRKADPLAIRDEDQPFGPAPAPTARPALLRGANPYGFVISLWLEWPLVEKFHRRDFPVDPMRLQFESICLGVLLGNFQRLVRRGDEDVEVVRIGRTRRRIKRHGTEAARHNS